MANMKIKLEEARVKEVEFEERIARLIESFTDLENTVKT